MKSMPGWLKFLLKVLVSVLCLVYVVRKIDWQETVSLLHSADLVYLLPAVLLFALSKLLSAYRLNIYFNNARLKITQADNIRLYMLGMYYNLFLPGGIGGDAYKVILLKRHAPNSSTKLISAAVLLDRVSGLAGLGILASILYGWLFKTDNSSVYVMLAVLPALYLFYAIISKWFPLFRADFFKTLWLGIGVQLLQVASVCFIVLSIDITDHLLPFLLLFLLSSVVAIFPFTIGGLGARELVFLWGARQFNLQEEQAVFISLLFYFITVLVSALGLWYVFKQPIKNNIEVS